MNAFLDGLADYMLAAVHACFLSFVMCNVVVGVVVSGSGGEVVSGGGVVMTVSGGQELLPWNVASARCAQVEPGGGVNSRAITGCRMISGMHILTRESQEEMAGTGNVSTTDLASSINVAVWSLTV